MNRTNVDAEYIFRTLIEIIEARANVKISFELERKKDYEDQKASKQDRCGPAVNPAVHFLDCDHLAHSGDCVVGTSARAEI